METASRLRILVVEDDEEQAVTFELLLTQEFDAEVVIAESCRAARELLAEDGGYELVTLDYQMPDGDGLQLLQEITAIDDAPTVVMVTGHGDELTAVRAFKLGASGYVVKDHRLRALLVEEIRSALAKSALKDAQEALRKSEEHFRSLIENALDIIVVLNKDLVATYVSPSIERILGYTLEDVADRGIELYVHHEDVERLALAVEAFGNPGNLYSSEFRVRDKDGEWHHMAARGMSMVKDSGEVELIINARDITDRKRAEDSLQASEEMFRNLAENTSAGIVIYQGPNLRYVNAAAQAMAGYSFEELAGMNFWDFAPPYLTDALKQRGLARQRGERVPSRYELPFTTKSGELRYADFSAVQIEYEGGPAIIATLIDITDRKQAAEQLQAANAELLGFANTVSHDIKGPITSTLTGLGALVALLREPGGELDRGLMLELAGTLESSLQKSCAMVEDLLALAASGQTPEKTWDVDIGQIVAKVLNELELDIRENSIELEVDGDLGVVKANGTQVYQIFSNLIGNAVRHNDSGTPVVRIAYLGEDDAGLHSYLVRENGSGIPEESIDRLFEPFFRGQGSGTGIGLAIVDKLVKIYGGWVRAYNDGGACFEFAIGDLETTLEAAPD